MVKVTELAEEELAQAFKALGHPMRLSILQWRKDPGVCLKHIQARAGVSQSTASQFMAVLQRAGLVTSNRIGPWTHYQRNEQRISSLGRTLGADI